MKIESCVKEAFTVIGREGSTNDGAGFVRRLWEEANSRFPEVANLAKKDEAGKPLGIWGAMSDFSCTFAPWEENFTRGLYLAGVECEESAQPPDGWTKWRIPGFEYLYVECDHASVFAEMTEWMRDKNIPLAGAVQDFTCPKTGKNYMFFPIRKL